MVYNVGIYCRLSREDLKNGKRDVSMSIENQQAMLTDHVNKEGWNVYKVYIDDDITGTTFDRPSFQQMMRDIENAKINCVLTKDLSRLGRNYIEAGRHRELFSEMGVRYIAIHDNYDSLTIDSYDITTPIKEIVNEMYAADISRKVRLTKQLMATQGKFANSRAPYGYCKSPENKHVLIIDENASHNVKRIFELCTSGMTGRAIAEQFNDEGILSPNEYYYKTIGKPNPFKNNSNCWGSGTIRAIIKNPVYYGAMSSGKRTVTSFKNKRIIAKPSDEWVIVENTHEPIICKKTWLKAQQLTLSNYKNHVRRNVEGEISLFAGIIKCADCGNNMAFGNKKYKERLNEFYRCSSYVQKGKGACSMHKVNYDVIYNAVLSDIQQYAVLAVEDEAKLIDRILKDNNEFKAKSLSRYEKNIRQAQNRMREIDGLLQSLFEEKVSGGVSAEMFKRMANKYEIEQRQLQTELQQLDCEITECKRVEQDLTGWIKRIKECMTLDTITRAIAIELIERIEVSEKITEKGEKYLDVNIFYKFGLKTEKENRAC